MQILKSDRVLLDKKRMQSVTNADFMETIFSIASKYSIFSKEDIDILTSEKAHTLFGASTKPILIDITDKDESEINELIHDNYDNGRSIIRYYRKPEYIFNGRKYIASNDMYGKYKNGFQRSSDNRTPLYEWFIKKIDFNLKKNSIESENKLHSKDQLEYIKKYIAFKGFSFEDGLIENFYLSLKSKPFVILAGTSGTGKTRLVRLFAEAVGATTENGRYKLVSVRPDWSDSSDLFGYVNLQGEFKAGAIIDFVKAASEDLEHPYFLCMDEMNLARVEYYLSDFLSIIETRQWENDKIKTDPVLLDQAANEKYAELYLPENFYIIGTVNMDETTFPFSKKVLDRANTIEFSYVDLKPTFESDLEEVKPVSVDNSFLKTEYIILAKDIDVADREFVLKICDELESINQILQLSNAHVGYRVRDEIVFYMLNNRNANLLEENEALDNEIMQKILPRIQGSGTSVKELLSKLFKKFAGDYSGLSQDTEWKQMSSFMESKTCKYQKSAEKVCYMMRRFEEDGFTSYWL